MSGCVTNQHCDMNSLEPDGFVRKRKALSDDPFDNIDIEVPEKSPTVPLELYSDISDDDFVFPCSQKRLPKRSV